MVKDHLEQALSVGDRVIWANYGRIYMGLVIKVMRQRVRLKNIITGGLHQPLPSKIIKVESLPPAALFAAIKGVE